MATQTQYIDLKKQLKKLCFEIRGNRNILKNAQRKGTANWKTHLYLRRSKYEFRHKHIIASLLRGKTREQIEQYVSPGHELNETYLKKLSQEYEVENGIEEEQPIRSGEWVRRSA